MVLSVPKSEPRAVGSSGLYMCLGLTINLLMKPWPSLSKNHTVTSVCNITFYFYNFIIDNQVLVCHWLVLGTLFISPGPVVSHIWSHVVFLFPTDWPPPSDEYEPCIISQTLNLFVPLPRIVCQFTLYSYLTLWVHDLEYKCACTFTSSICIGQKIATFRAAVTLVDIKNYIVLIFGTIDSVI